MAWRIRYQVNIDWVGPGAGPMTGAGAALPIGGSGAQTLDLMQTGYGTVVAGTTVGPPPQMTGADVTTLTNAMAADIAAQMNVAATLAKMNGWPTGQP